mmetsp:Transcript_106218/g.298672  ORF Transcript_106218/g.298672 Transcript_106218/m.298672 type:complete len:726 (-) Transcript_106218:187-2364(-)
MQFFGAILAFAARSALASVASPSSTHPIESVITTLQDLTAKVNAEAATEEVTYTKFSHWCANSMKTLNGAIAAGNAKADALDSKVAAKTQQMKSLSMEIATLESEIGKLEASDKAAGAQRRATASLYASAEQDYTETIQAIADALAALEGAQAETATLLSVQQRVRKVLAFSVGVATGEQRDVLQAFLQEGGSADDARHAGAPSPAAASKPRPDFKAQGDYGAHVKPYAFKSSPVIELLKELKAKFEEEKLSATKAETNSLNAASLASDARSNAIKAAEFAKAVKIGELSAATEDKNTAVQDLQQTRDDLDADSTNLVDSQKQCSLKESEYAERSDIRKRELEALAAAIDILAKVSGVRTEPPSNPVPPPSPMALFLQEVANPRSRVVKLLTAEAREVHSQALERLAQEISAHSSTPFNEVNNMIQKLIFRLMDEQKDEDTHKKWCDLEMDKSNTSKVTKEDKIASLTAKISKATATAQLLAEDISTNEDMVSTIVAHMKDATEIRETGKRENAVSIKDAEDAQTALANAVAVLETFYKDSGKLQKKAWEFLQRGVDLPTQPALWGSSYTGVADPVAGQPEGIIAILKRVSADFARMEADTRAQEASDQAAYEEDMKSCEIERARRVKENEMKTQERSRLVEKNTATEKSRKQVSTELEAVDQYLKDLVPACVEGDSTYEARKSARDKEIAALHEAQGILANAFAASAPAPAPAAAFLAPAQRHS